MGIFALYLFSKQFSSLFCPEFQLERKKMIQIFVTGGTFDKEYNLINGELYFKDTHLNEMLKLGRCTQPVNVKTLMMLDSLQMTDDDRQIIQHNCKKSESKNILITHGTDTMVLTARFLADSHELEDKTIVLTGAMIPFAFGTSSDGFFNLGNAIAFCQCLPPGIYIAMNGRYFNWNNVRKNRQTGNFEEVNIPEMTDDFLNKD